MPHAKVNGIEVCFEEFGSEEGAPLLLIMGFTAQMISWDEGFCDALVRRGFRVIRFDNRDAGLSSKTQDAPPRFARSAGGVSLTGSDDGPPYTLADMANDAVGLLDELGISRAHVAGASMGGMIAQRVAIDHPHRVASLTSIMSTTGNREVGQPDPQALTALLTPVPPERDAAIAHSVSVARITHGPLFDADQARVRAERAYDRAFNPAGAAYQLAAILADGDRTEQLSSITAPTLVIHGAADRLIGPSGGEATAAAIPHAELLILDQMGHDLPSPLWDEIAEAIARVAAKAPVP